MQLPISHLVTWSIVLGSTIALQKLPLPVETVANIGLGVWVENIAVRASGEILAVGLTPNLFQVDPYDPTPVIIQTFPSPITALAGIVETFRDVFYITAGNVSNTTIVATPGTLSVWEVDMNTYMRETGLAIPIKKIADFPEAGLLDGMTLLSASKGLILISDPIIGVVWRLNVRTGDKCQILSLADMKATAGLGPALGVNGIRYSRGYLYFTTTTKQILVRLPIYQNGSAAGDPVILNAAFGRPDDFALDDVRNAYVAVNSSSLGFLTPSGNSTILAGSLSSNVLSGITGAKFGRTRRDRKVLYMGTTGGSVLYATTRNFTIPGGIRKINIGRSGYFNLL